LTTIQSLSIRQRVEGFNISDFGWGAAGAATVTLSFWVRSSVTGTYGGSICNGNEDRSYPFTFAISSANTWEQKSVTIAGDTSGTWATDNSTGLNVFFSVGAGPDRSGTAGAWASAAYYSATGAINMMATLNATFYITGVQLEKGTVATSFDFRDYGSELILCQRYLPKLTINSYNYVGQVFATNDASITIPFPVETRTTATGFTSSGSISFSSANGTGIGSAVFSTATTLNARLNASGTSGFTAAGDATCLIASSVTIYFNGCEL
jgi:hypothetical protein